MLLKRWISANIGLLLLCIFAAAVGRCSKHSLFDVLSTIPFHNSGTVTPADEFVFLTERLRYAEPENVTVSNNAWITTQTHEYLYQVAEGGAKGGDALIPPPKGIRSSVPLGGISTGSFEVRGDGTFHEWTILNQSPAGQAKYGVVPDALLAVQSRDLTTGAVVTTPLRTRSFPKLAEKMTYSGSYPVSKLHVDGFDVFMYSTLRPLDLNRSATPAVVFTLSVSNTGPHVQNYSLLLNLPLLVEVDSRRAPLPNQPSGVSSFSPDYRQCVAQCRDAKCTAWSWEAQNCTLFHSYTPFNVYARGAFSGIGGGFDTKHGGRTDVKTGSTANPSAKATTAQGEASLWGVSEFGAISAFSATTSAEAFGVFQEFEAVGYLSPNESATDTMFAACATVVARPGENRTVSIVFSYHFPDRTYQQSMLGNFYANIYADVDAVGRSLGGGKDDSLLVQVVEDIALLHHVFENSSLSDLHKDWFINSFSHARSAMWFRDGRWRQWEAYDCDDLDSVHNDHQRHVPYLFYFAETEKNKMHAWAQYQLPDGMVQETLAHGCWGPPSMVDVGSGGNIMGDVTSVLILETLEIYRSTNDKAFLASMLPHVARGVEWQLNRSTEFGLPANLECTYDVLGFRNYSVAAFNAVMHLAAMRACEVLGDLGNLSTLVAQCRSGFEAGQKAIDDLLWYEEGGYYLAFTNASEGHFPIMGDTFYGQVLAFNLDLGPLVPTSKLALHLAQEVALGQTLFGIRVITGRYPIGFTNDNMIWMGGSQDWSTLQVWLQNATSPAWILNQSYIGLGHISETLRDMWNPHGIYAGNDFVVDGVRYDGKPWLTSHYGFHMPFWFLLSAMTRQKYDATAYDGSGLFRVDPAMDDSLGYSLPIMSPRFIGTLGVQCRSGGLAMSVQVLFGSLEVAQLQFRNVNLGRVSVGPGSSATWTVPSKEC